MLCFFHHQDLWGKTTKHRADEQTFDLFQIGSAFGATTPSPTWNSAKPPPFRSPFRGTAPFRCGTGSERGLNWGVCVSTYVLPIEVFPEEPLGWSELLAWCWSGARGGRDLTWRRELSCMSL